MKVVIAGSSGLIERRLAANLLSDGHEVAVLSRRPKVARRRLPRGVCVERWQPEVPSARLALLVVLETALPGALSRPPA